ncbi:MAG: hypothetical protein E7294_04055 [Lachnospiraceae bacterium]|nr:hypothetical protein [Lachnospiraceae bacterium]
MITLFSDLDHTMFFSHRVFLNEEKLPAEYLNGKEQSYIPAELYTTLKQYKDRLSLVPVTTRTIEQFHRLFLLRKDLHCRYALVCNGGILLENGQPRKDWYQETLKLSNAQNPEVAKAFSIAENRFLQARLHFPEPFFFYAACEDVQTLYDTFQNELDTNLVYIGKDSRKVYVIASSVSKGTAVKRFAGQFGTDRIMVAGDSEFDLSMLEYGEPAFLPKELSEKLSNPKKRIMKTGGLGALLAEELETEMSHT